MWPRKRLDIGWLDIAAARWACVASWSRSAAAHRLGSAWPSTTPSLPTLSVRSGLQLLLSNLEWPAGSEILMSAMTIPDMARIVRLNGYVPVPVDLDLDTAAPTLEMLERATTPATRGLIIAHLFGSRVPLAEILSFASTRGIAILEDCAQAGIGPEWTGSDDCLASLFSFGTIKTATACGGAMVTIRDAELARAAASAQESWAVQRRISFAIRLGRTLLLKALAYRPPFAVFRAACHAIGYDYGNLLNNSVRGFPGKQLVRQIQRSPSAPLMTLLSRRIRRFNGTRLDRRQQLGERLLAALEPHVSLLGHRGQHHTFWVFPVLATDPRRLISRLRQAGFDATQGQSMEIVAPPEGRADTAPTVRDAFPRIVYLPLYPDMPEAAIDRMGRVVCEVESGPR